MKVRRRQCVSGAARIAMAYCRKQLVWYDVVWWNSVEGCWRPERPGPCSNRDSITKQTLRSECTYTRSAEVSQVHTIGFVHGGPAGACFA